MALMRHALFLLTALAFYLGFFLAVLEAASCPAARINASEICEDVGSNSVKTAANLSYVICDNFQNLSQVNRTFIVKALEHVLRERNEVPQNVVKVLVNQVDEEELEAGLDEFNHKIVNSSLISPAWKSIVLRSLWDEKLRNEDRFNETSFVVSWFQKRLRPFISAISVDMLQCLANETLQCEQYQAIVKGLNKEFMKMSPATQAEVFHSFQLPYLKGLNSNGSACTKDLNSSSWLTVNFRRFSRYAKYQDFLSLNSKLVHMDLLQNLTAKQLGELSATVGTLRTPQEVEKVMGYVRTSTLTKYIDGFNSQANISLAKEIRAGLLQHILIEAQPIFQKADDGEFILWMERRLPVLIPGMNSTLVPLLFDPLESRNCSAPKAVVTLLNGSLGEFSNMTRQSIYEAILHLLSNSSLRCYASNSSFSVFLEETFQGFAELLTLSDLRTIIPSSGLQKVANTIPPDDLAGLFSRTGFLNDDPFLTAVLQNYNETGLFVDRFNQRDTVEFLPNATKTALLAGVWPTVVSSSANATEVDKWLQDRLNSYFTFLNGEVLNGTETLNASCETFHKIVSKLNENIVMFKGREEEIYYSIKAYLAATKEKPRCYNGNDPETSDWLVTYLGTYIRYTSARDMRLLTNHSTAIFQDLAFNRDNLELIYRHKVRKDLAEMYAAALFAVDPDFSLNSLPDQLLCFARHSTRISSLSPAEALSLIARVNLHCNSSRPSASDRQLATMLVGQVKTFDGPTLVALGQQAVGLTTGQIANLTAPVLMDARVLESLGQVTGWNRGQSQTLVNKILRNNFTLDSLEEFERLGTLVPGLPSITFDSISANLALGLSKSARFVRVLGQGPEHLKKAFVVKILSNASSPRDILNNVPDGFIGQVPSSLLVLRGKIPELGKVNKKSWSPQQAAVLFGDVLSNTENYTELSAFILQGFQCNAASKLRPDQLSDLVQEVKVKNANLSEEQLSCMARLLARNNLTTNFTTYPPDVLLFFPLNKIDNQSCVAFYSLASQGNLSLLTNGSTQRTRLVGNALGCFGVRNMSLSKEQLQHLGAFVCDMDASTIENSNPGILENLRLCPDLTMSQRTAFNGLLSSGKTTYKAPASWDDGTLESLGILAAYLNLTTWDSINKEERKVFIRNMADAYDSLSALQKEKMRLFFKAVGREAASSSRARRATETCKTNPITATSLEDSLFMIRYDNAQEFEACLSDEVLKANLALLMEQPLPNDYLSVVKRKLDKVYPDGIPEGQLKLLGPLSRQYRAEEIAKWNVTSRDTLAALLNPENGPWDTAQIKQLIARYMESGGTLTGPLLDILGGQYLCYLEEDQLKQIDPEAIRHTEMLDLSTCPQGKKNILYGKARQAFAGQEGTGAYYHLIQPYLGGAPVEDLKKLVGSEVTMDIKTFLSLNPEELQKLSVQDVKGLMGVNLPALKEKENDPSVARWIKSQYQSELDTLGIGLTGGMTALSPTEARSTAINVSSDARTDAPVTPISAANHSTTPDSHTPTLSSLTSAGRHSVIPVAATGSHLTPFSNVTPVAIAVTNTTVPPIVVVPKVDFPTETTVVSSNVTATPEDALSRTPDSTTRRGLSTTTADSSSPVLLNTTVDSAVAFPTEVTATSSDFTTPSDGIISGAPVPVFTARDTNRTISGRTTVDSNTTTTSDTALPATTVDSTMVVPTNITTSDGIISGVPVPVFTARDINTTISSRTTADSNTTTTSDATLPATTVDSTVVVPTNITTSDGIISGAPVPVFTARDTNTTISSRTTADSNTTTTSDATLPATTVDSTMVVPTNITTSDGIISGAPVPVFTARDTNTTISGRTTADSDTTTINDQALRTTTVDSTTVVPTLVTSGSNNTLVGILAPGPTGGTHLTFSAKTTPATSNTTTHTSPPPVATDSNVTMAPNTTFSLTPAILINLTTSARASTTGSKDFTSTRSGVTLTSIARPPTPPQPRPNATSPASTRRPSSKAPPRTKAPVYPTPNGYINIQPLSALASRGSLSWLLLTLSLIAGVSVQSWHL